MLSDYFSVWSGTYERYTLKASPIVLGRISTSVMTQTVKTLGIESGGSSDYNKHRLLLVYLYATRQIVFN